VPGEGTDSATGLQGALSLRETLVMLARTYEAPDRDAVLEAEADQAEAVRAHTLPTILYNSSCFEHLNNQQRCHHLIYVLELTA
jgi:TusA-related sulfurtransferase